MDGQYLNKKIIFEEFLSNWINSSIKNKSWENYGDLHLDEIDNDFLDKSTWINGSLFLFNSIIKLIDIDSFNSILTISLACDLSKLNLKSISVENLEEYLSLTPPSFYIFPNGEKNYEETIRDLNPSEFLSKMFMHKTYFKIIEDSDGDFCTIIYLIAKEFK